MHQNGSGVDSDNGDAGVELTYGIEVVTDTDLLLRGLMTTVPPLLRRYHCSRVTDGSVVYRTAIIRFC